MDKEKNVLNITNDDGLLKADERNVNQLGQDVFREEAERFSIEEQNIKNAEHNELRPAEEKKKTKKEEKDNKNALSNFASSIGAVGAIPGVIAVMVFSVAIIGTTSGLFPMGKSSFVTNFLSRSTELGFEIDRDPNKSYVMYLSNEEYQYSQVIYFVDQVVFEDLMPNTLYDLNCYDTSVDPMKLVFSSNYLTKSYDDYSSFVTNKSVEEDILTINLEYEGNNIEFVTVVIYGDDDRVLYTYEGAPIDEVQVNVAGNSNVTCKISVNGELTHFEQLVFEEEIIPVESISLDKEELMIETGSTYQFETSILPENATNKGVVYSSSNEKVATIKGGLLTALKEGNTIISAKTLDGNKVATCLVKVTLDNPIIPVESVSLDKEELDLFVGDKYTLNATILPQNATDKSIIWESEDDNIATVKNGLVTAIGVGNTNVFAKTKDGDLFAVCRINVTEKEVAVNGVNLDYDELEISVNEEVTLIATVLPLDATNKEVIWSSTDSNIVSVTSNGTIKGVSVGEAIITVKTVDGEYQDYCVVNVI